MHQIPKQRSGPSFSQQNCISQRAQSGTGAVLQRRTIRKPQVVGSACGRPNTFGGGEHLDLGAASGLMVSYGSLCREGINVFLGPKLTASVYDNMLQPIVVMSSDYYGQVLARCH